MTEKYVGRTQDRRYSGEDVDITYSLKRCIHAKDCVNRLSEVFDIDKRPWINPDGTSADRVAEMVPLCPSGALHYDAKAGDVAETTPDKNIIQLWKDGPLQFTGNLTIQGASVDISDETRATLCRCGASENKPFCDNTHKEIDFHTEVTPVESRAGLEVKGGNLVITATENGPYGVEGNLEIIDEQNNVIFAGNKTWLCRCGGSSKKPFCDGTHNKIDFTAE